MRTVVVLVSAFLQVVILSLSLSRFPVFWKGHVTGPIQSFEEMGEDGDWPSLEKGGSADDECDGETFVKNSGSSFSHLWGEIEAGLQGRFEFGAVRQGRFE